MVSIVIVNWNRYEDTAVCLESLQKLSYPQYSIVVVDNGSSDGSEARLRQNYPLHTILQAGQNLGLAGGSNLGIRHSLDQGADHVLLLNNDTVVSKDAVSELVKLMDSDPGIGLAAGKIYFMDPPGRVWSYGGCFNVDNGSARHFRSEQEARLPLEEPLFSYLPACLLMIRRKCIDDVGLLTDKYFHLGEDVEYCIRAQKKGWKTALTPRAVIYHKGSASMEHLSPVYNYYEQRNRLYIVNEYHTAGRPLVFRVGDFLTIIGRLLRAMVMPRSPVRVLENLKCVIMAVMDFFAGRHGRLVRP